MAQLLPSYTGKLLFHLRTYSQEATGPPPPTVWPKANWDYRSSVTGSCGLYHIRVLAMGNSIKEAISIMKAKQIFISILAVLFVFPFRGNIAQQAPNSGSIEVITTFDYPATGNLTEPQ